MDKILDVPNIPAPVRFQTIRQTVFGLNPGETLIIVNDHDPAHLQGMLQTERPGEYEWEYLQQGPDVWRVKITWK